MGPPWTAQLVFRPRDLYLILIASLGLNAGRHLVKSLWLSMSERATTPTNKPRSQVQGDPDDSESWLVVISTLVHLLATIAHAAAAFAATIWILLFSDVNVPAGPQSVFTTAVRGLVAVSLLFHLFVVAVHGTSLLRDSRRASRPSRSHDSVIVQPGRLMVSLEWIAGRQRPLARCALLVLDAVAVTLWALGLTSPTRADDLFATASGLFAVTLAGNHAAFALPLRAIKANTSTARLLSSIASVTAVSSSANDTRALGSGTSSLTVPTLSPPGQVLGSYDSTFLPQVFVSQADTSGPPAPGTPVRPTAPPVSANPLTRRAAWTFGSAALVCVAAAGVYARAWVATVDANLTVAVVVSHVVAECARFITDARTVSVIRLVQRQGKRPSLSVSSPRTRPSRATAPATKATTQGLIREPADMSQSSVLCRAWAGSAGEDVWTVVGSVRPSATQLVAASTDEVDLNTAQRTTLMPGGGAGAPERPTVKDKVASTDVLDMNTALRMGP
ncbi:hypothetical protein, variant [Allomyces macrogynus ATCC 38327]|nr:hypothetical protein, variant [Allomyces macrogynus ATCC 38327]|eukprot:KNE69050.1 hypothetical protein, variant [Allomyces macrogynus ATCC 38327]